MTDVTAGAEQGAAEAEAVEEPIVVAEGGAAVAPEGDAAVAGDDLPAPKKGNWAQKRIDELTGEKYEEKRAREAAEARADAAEALLRGAGKTPDPAAAEPLADGERRFTQAEVDQQATQIAAVRSFNERCDALFDSGTAKHEDWTDTVKTLNQAGVMSPLFVEAAMETGAAEDVLHHLGQDPEEAQRIGKLPPVRMGVELAKLAAKLAAPKPGPKVSGAPDPIKPLGGAAKPEADIYDPNLSDEEYIARRKQMGAKYIA